MRSIDLAAGDLVFVHSDISAFGKLAARTGDELAHAVIDAFKEVVTESGIIIMPTFTYSFCRNEKYDPLRTPSRVGALTNAFLRDPEVVRTMHPIFSVGVWGRDKKTFIGNLGKDSFGPDSIFGRIHRDNGDIMFFGASFQTCTFLHYIEQAVGVPYRYMKIFDGVIVDRGQDREDTCTYFVRHLDGTVQVDTTRLENRLLQERIMKEEKLGIGRMLKVSAGSLFEEVCRQLRADNRYLLRQTPTDNG